MGISLGIVGLGAFGSTFARLFKLHPQVDRIALCDREPERIERFARDPSFRDKFTPADAYGSLDELCAADLDAVAIITQPWLHAPQAIAALESGKHVYSAVPVIMVPDGDEILEWCDRLVRAVERTGLHYMLGETTFYRPETMYCRRRSAAGAFGRFVYAEGEYFHDVEDPRSNLREVKRRRLTGKAGAEWQRLEAKYHRRGLISGPMHYPTHSTCGPISVMGAHMVKVSCMGYTDPDGDPFHGDEFSNETAQFRMSNGAVCRICEYRQVGHHETETFRIFGTRATYKDMTWVDLEGAAPVPVDQMRDPLPEAVAQAYRDGTGSDVYGGHGGSHAYLVHEFVDAVARDRSPAIDVWEAVRYMAPGVMAHKSALRDGEVLEVPDWGGTPPGREEANRGGANREERRA